MDIYLKSTTRTSHLLIFYTVFTLVTQNISISFKVLGILMMVFWILMPGDFEGGL